MSDPIDNDPRWMAAVIDEQQTRAAENKSRAISNQAHAIAELVKNTHFSHPSIVQAVTSNDLSLLEKPGPTKLVTG